MDAATRGRLKFQDQPYSTITGLIFRNISARNGRNPEVVIDAHVP